ncbi:MAG: ABC transporter permease [Ferruginibacter sp.]
MILNYFKIAWRSILHNKKTSAINIAGLAMGMAVVVLIGLWVYDELSFNKNFRNYPRIAQVIQNVTNNGEVSTWNNVPFPLAQELRSNYGSDFKHVVMMANRNDHIVVAGEKKLKINGGFFENGATEMFSFHMKQGNGSMAEPASLLMSESAAKACFGNEPAIGKLLQVDKMPPLKVTGIYADFPDNSTFKKLDFVSTWDFFAASNNGFKDMDDPWRPNFVTLYAELNDQADMAAVSLKIKDAKLKNVNPQLQQKKPQLFLQPMSKWHLYADFKDGKNTGGDIQYVRMFGIVGIFVLLLACINFINLSTARSEKRAKEVGIRKTIGSARSQLIAQFFTESMLIVFIAFAIAILLVWISFPSLNQLAGKQMAMFWTSPVFWIISILFLLFTAFVSGSYPAFYLSSFKPVKVLKGSFKGGRFAGLPRKVLVVTQFTVSIALIIGTLVVYRQLDYARQRSAGYTRDMLVSLPVFNSSIHDHFNAFETELLQTGVVSTVAETESPVTDVWNTTSGISWPGKDPNLSTDFAVLNVTPDFGKTIQWKIKAGRDFSKAFATDSSAVILNEAAVKFMGLANPVGSTITSWGDPLTVIGVVEDIIVKSPYGNSAPAVYTTLTYPGNFALLKLTGSLPAGEALAKIETVYKKFNTEQPFEYQFADEEYARKFANEVRIGNLAGIFTLLAVIISCLGLFGLASFVVEQRQKEIGVRKVLGASVYSIWQLLSRDFVLLVLIAFIISVPISWYFMSSWLQNYSYRTNMAWWIFALAGIGALIIAVAVVSMQAAKASLTNPVKSLRSE